MACAICCGSRWYKLCRLAVKPFARLAGLLADSKLSNLVTKSCRASYTTVLDLLTCCQECTQDTCAWGQEQPEKSLEFALHTNSAIAPLRDFDMLTHTMTPWLSAAANCSKLVSVSSDLNTAWLCRSCEVLALLEAAQACSKTKRACFICMYQVSLAQCTAVPEGLKHTACLKCSCFQGAPG